MSDEMHDRLESYGEAWRDAQPPPRVGGDVLAPAARRRWQPMAAAASVVALGLVGSIVVLQLRGDGPGGQATLDFADQRAALDHCAEKLAQYGPNEYTGPTFDGRLPADFQPVAALDCWTESETVAGDGVWLVLQERRSEDAQRVTEFATAMRLPDQPSEGDEGCRAIKVSWPDVLLFDAAGRKFRPNAPSSHCGKPREEVMRAYDALTPTMRVVGSQRVQQVESEEARRSGCSDLWKNVPKYWSSEPVPQSSYGPGTNPTGVQRVCTYVVDSTENDLLRRTDGGWVSAADAQRLADGLAGLPAARACSTQASNIAVLHLGDGGLTHVELDGCLRVFIDGQAPKQGSADLASLLTRVAGDWESVTPPSPQPSEYPTPPDKTATPGGAARSPSAKPTEPVPPPPNDAPSAEPTNAQDLPLYTAEPTPSG